MNKVQDKLNTLAADWGYESPLDMLESVGLLAAPAICMNDDCDYTTDIEPDNGRGWCECCETRTVASALLLAGFIHMAGTLSTSPIDSNISIGLA